MLTFLLSENGPDFAGAFAKKYQFITGKTMHWSSIYFFVQGKYCVWLVGKLATFNLIKYMKFRASYLFIWHRFLQMLFFQLVEREQSIMKLAISAPFSVDTSGTVLLCHFKFEHYDACGGRRATTTTLGRSPSDRFETSGFNHY